MVSIEAIIGYRKGGSTEELLRYRIRNIWVQIKNREWQRGRTMFSDLGDKMYGVAKSRKYWRRWLGEEREENSEGICVTIQIKISCMKKKRKNIWYFIWKLL